MTKVTVFWKLEKGDEDIEAHHRFAEYEVEVADVEDGFLNLYEKVGGRATHISVDQIASWTEEPSN
jgi:hypothetical protein